MSLEILSSSAHINCNKIQILTIEYFTFIESLGAWDG